MTQLFFDADSLAIQATAYHDAFCSCFRMWTVASPLRKGAAVSNLHKRLPTRIILSPHGSLSIEFGSIISVPDWYRLRAILELAVTCLLILNCWTISLANSCGMVGRSSDCKNGLCCLRRGNNPAKSIARASRSIQRTSSFGTCLVVVWSSSHCVIGY